MKKLAILCLFVCGSMFYASAQNISENALGLRLGNSDGFGAEISYQRAIGDSNRLELDLGWRNAKDYDAFKLTGIYQWVWNIDGGFNWYAGAGGGLGSWNSNRNDIDDDGVFVFAVGTVGIEYDFDFPLIISLDFRPELGFINGSDNFNNNLELDFALGIRYQF